MTSSYPNRRYLTDLSRGAAGALIFGLPLMMTHEMWSVGVTISPVRLGVVTVASVPMLIVLSHFVGFEESSRPIDHMLDACAAYGIGVAIAVLMLGLFGILRAKSSLDDVVGKVGLQAVGGSIGALLAQSQFGQHKDHEQQRKRQASYAGALFLMAVGALFLSLSIAPTQEVVIIASRLGPWLTLLLVAVTLVTMHAFVYAVEFSGAPESSLDTPWWSVFVRYGITGYALVLVVSASLLWIFGRTEGLGLFEILKTDVVLAMPSSVGAAAARLIL